MSQSANTPELSLPLAAEPMWYRSSSKLRLRAQALAVLGGGILFSSLVLINFYQVLSLLILPISPHGFRRVNRELAGAWWGLCLLWMRYVLKIKVVRTGDALPLGQNAFYFANHQQMPDIGALFFPAAEAGRLGDLKWFVKEPLKYVPGMGWGMLFLDCIFLKRDWLADRHRVERTFQSIRKHQIPFWITSFVEGTRITPKKLKKSQEFAAKRGLTQHRNVLNPKTKGFSATITSLRDRLDSIIDVTIAYEGGIPTLWQFALGWTPTIHLDVRRFPIEGLPQTENELADWLNRRFDEKDARLTRFQKVRHLLLENDSVN